MDRMPRFPSLFSYQRINATVLPMLGGIFLFLHLSVPVAVALLSVCAVGLLIWSFFKRGEGRRVLLCFLAGIGLSLLLMGLAGVEQLRLERLCSGSHRVEGYVVANEGKEYDLLSSRLDSKSFRKRIRVRTDASWQVGEKRSLELDLYAPNPKQGRAEGVSLLATLRRDGGVVGESRLYSLVGNVRQTLRREFSRQDNGGFLSAILLGDRSALTKGQTAAFRRTASSHILAISGLHISQTVTFLVCFLRLFPIPKRGIRIILFPVVAILYLLAGAGISVFRASVMTLFSMTALLLRHRGDSTTALTFSAALLVFANPYALESPSFLLSYASTFGMTTCGVPMSEYAEESFREKGIPPMIRLLRYPVLGLVLASVAFVFTAAVFRAFGSFVSDCADSDAFGQFLSAFVAGGRVCVVAPFPRHVPGFRGILRLGGACPGGKWNVRHGFCHSPSRCHRNCVSEEGSSECRIRPPRRSVFLLRSLFSVGTGDCVKVNRNLHNFLP